ncbi:unnamed protein product [Ceratitis capitata]|uniref:(Mediterranean fruit fly) hypothetical protein n=1 Tax=Ceratitis capitata TaxID=7213 RepID=A0A811VE74_CERCA|nr:unnamed protein product [Ceratitis capitata]
MPVHLKPINVHVDTYNRMRHQMQVAEISPYNKCSTLLAGISAVVGVIGGVCLLTSGVKTVINKICEGRVSKKESSNEDICNVCSCQIDLNESKNFVTCYICNKEYAELPNARIGCRDLIVGNANYVKYQRTR